MTVKNDNDGQTPVVMYEYDGEGRRVRLVHEGAEAGQRSMLGVAESLAIRANKGRK